MRFQSERNQRRDDGVADRADEHAMHLGFVGRCEPGRGVIVFGHGKSDVWSNTTRNRKYVPAFSRTTKEALVSFVVSDQARITFGRMRFSDLNKWVADAAVDGLQYGRKSKARVTEFAALAGTGDISASDPMAHHGRLHNNVRYGAMALFENDGADNRIHLSGYANATVSQRHSCELNIGEVAADTENGKNAGFAFDVRSIHRFSAGKLNPQLMVGFAAGSEGFRQSGLHSGKTYNRGQTQVHRYGYAFQPDLTNLVVGSVAVGIGPSRKLSVDPGLHVFGQFRKSSAGPNARLVGATTGRSASSGTEVSLSAHGTLQNNSKSGSASVVSRLAALRSIKPLQHASECACP